MASLTEPLQLTRAGAERTTGGGGAAARAAERQAFGCVTIAMTSDGPRYSVTAEHNQALWPGQGAVSLDYQYRGGDNQEWRECAIDVVARLREEWDVVEVSAPSFEPFEDFVELAYSIAGTRVTLHSDSILDTIWLSCEDAQLLGQLMRVLGKRVGWTNTSD